MKIALVYPTFLPGQDGIGDYSLHLASELCRHADVSVHASALATNLPQTPFPIQKSFHLDSRSGITELLEPLSSVKPDWVLFQYNPFSYGKYGINFSLPTLYKSIRKKIPGTRIATMIHEPYVPFGSLKLSVLSLIHRAQLKSLGENSDHIFVSIEAWTKEFQTWFSRVKVEQLSVGSNIPLMEISKAEARERLEIPSDAFVVGSFGSNHPSRLFSWIEQGFEQIRAQNPKAHRLSMGSGQKFLSAEDVSVGFRAMDLYLSPFIDGVSARRTSFMTGIQHGIPTISTSGFLTDSVFHSESEKSYSLVPTESADLFVKECVRLTRDSTRRAAYSQNAKEFYLKHFDWKIIVNRLVLGLGSSYT